MKRVIAAFLSVVLVYSCFGFCVAAAADNECTCGKPPLVYVEGQTDIYDDPNSENRKKIPEPFDIGEILKSAGSLLPLLTRSVITDQWDEYANAFADILIPYLDGYALNPDTTIPNASGPTFTWSPETVSTKHSNESVFTYEFRYDQRKDPWLVADELDAFIRVVQEKTHHSKVCLMSRCMGTAVAMAYLVKYQQPKNYADIYSFVYYNSTAAGFGIMNDVFTGNIALQPAYIGHYLASLLDDSALNAFLKAGVNLITDTYGIHLGCKAIQAVYNNIYTITVPRVMLQYYGSTPGYWGMVDDEHFEEAKKFMFSGKEEEYKVLIEQIDNYHEKVMKNIPQVLLQMHETGMSVGIVCKYGFDLPPVVSAVNKPSDKLIEVEKQSFGATGADIGTVFSDAYLEEAAAAGTARYISPDRVIDASTCLMPDNTWFVRDVEHIIMPLGVDPLLVSIARHDRNFTVWDDENFPQYMKYDRNADAISPLTQDDFIDPTPIQGNFFRDFADFLKTMCTLFKVLIREKLIPA